MCFKRMMRIMDAIQRRLQHITTFTDDPRCLLRISLDPAARDLTLSDGTEIHQGDRVCLIHLWNERVPQISSAGADMTWAMAFWRDMLYSFHLLSLRLREDPEMKDVPAIVGKAFVGSPYDHDEFKSIVKLVDFDVIAPPRPKNPWARFMRFVDGVYARLLVWTYNPGSLAGARWIRRGDELWMSRETLIRQFGAPHGRRSRQDQDPQARSPISTQDGVRV